MIVAILESENFSWYALGETLTEALTCIRKEWNKRQDEMKKYGRKPIYKFKSNKELLDYYDVMFIPLEKGRCYVR